MIADAVGRIPDAAGRIPHADLITIGGGHYVQVTRPAEFADAVLAWLRGLTWLGGTS